MTALQASDLALDVLDGLLEGCQVVGPDFTYLYLNEAVAVQARRPKAELLGRRMTDCYPGIDQTAMFGVLRACMEQRRHASLLNEFEYPDGAKRWFELRFVPVPRGVCIFSLDVTERKQAEDRLKQSEQMFRDLASAAPDGILAVAEDGTIRFANSEAERMFGYAEGALRGESLETLLPHGARTGHATMRAAFFAEPRPHRVGSGRALTARRKNGEIFPVEVSLSASLLAGERVALSAIRDISAQRKLEAQLRQAQKMEAIGRLAGGVAHDFNNLLSIVLGYSDLLLDTLEPVDPIRADLEEIRAAGGRARELTRQLLALSRQQILQPQALCLNDLLGSLERMLRRLIGEDIELTVLRAADLGTVIVDPSQLDQVVVNLAVNARDAMPDGGRLTIETANVMLGAEYAAEHPEVTAGPHVLLAVTDTGHGMDAATQGRIFEPFFTTKELGKGTGLGLSTVFGIVRQSGGHIWVYSELGRGTTFKLYFPRTDAPPQPVRHSVAPPVRRPATETVLVVEDDPRVRGVVRTILERQGYRVLDAQSAGDALVLSEQHPGTIHLLVTDVVMPRIGGRELAQRLLAERPEMRVLFMSGYTENSVLHHGVLAPGMVFVPKPITPEALASKVREVLGAG